MLTIIQRLSAYSPNLPPMRQRMYVIAFHNSYGKAVTLPHFEPVNLEQANQVLHELETTGTYTHPESLPWRSLSDVLERIKWRTHLHGEFKS